MEKTGSHLSPCWQLMAHKIHFNRTLRMSLCALRHKFHSRRRRAYDGATGPTFVLANVSNFTTFERVRIYSCVKMSGGEMCVCERPT